MFNVTKSAVLGSLVLTLVGVFGLVSMHREANASPRQAASSAPSSLTISRDDVPTPPPVVTVQEVIVAAPKAIKKPAKPAKAKTYQCGQFEPLQNDAVQQVRRCEFR